MGKATLKAAETLSLFASVPNGLKCLTYLMELWLKLPRSLLFPPAHGCTTSAPTFPPEETHEGSVGEAFTFPGGLSYLHNNLISLSVDHRIWLNDGQGTGLS